MSKSNHFFGQPLYGQLIFCHYAKKSTNNVSSFNKKLYLCI